MKKILFLLVVFALLLSCSKDESATSVDQIGGEIFRYQAVSITLADVTLSEIEYQGTLGGAPVTLTRKGTNTLVFAVPPNEPLGNSDLFISSLNNFTIHYIVMDTVLTDTPGNTLANFFGNLDSYTQQVGTPSTPEYETSLRLISALNTFYNDATTEQKEVMAKLYKANKGSFDFIIMAGIDGMGRFTPTTFASVARGMFVAAVQGLVVGVAVIAISNWVVSNPALFAAIKVVGIVVAGVSLALATAKLADFIHAPSKAVHTSIASLQGTNNRNVNNSFLTVLDNVSFISPLKTHRRSINMSDSSSTNNLIVGFFDGYSTYSATLETINSGIDYINNYNPIYDIPNVPIRLIPVTTQESEETMTQEIFDAMTFNVSNPNLSLVSVSLQSDGQMNLKIKIIGTPASVPVESYLNYSYSDEFSSFSGKFPINVVTGTCTPSMVVGNWTIQEYLIDNSNPDGYVMANYSLTMTVESLPSACGDVASGSLIITHSPSNSTSQYCWYLSDCTMHFGGYLFQFIPGTSVFTSNNSYTPNVHHAVLTKL